MPVLSRCVCGADCDFAERGGCDGYMKVTGHRGPGLDTIWIHTCHEHRDLPLTEYQNVTLFPHTDWSTPSYYT